MTENPERPAFGLLQGFRVVMTGQSVAAPFAAALYAEHGADVIWVENPATVDPGRTARRSGAWQQDRRNMRSLSLDYVSDEGREVFLRLLETADVLIEASVGGRFARLGLGDSVLWAANPRLVVVHISGFGQTGDERWVRRASYDPIAQAFGCAMRMNGVAGMPSAPAMPFPADYTAAFFGFGMANAALLRRRVTGRGESIDVAQFEAMMRIQANYPTDFLRYGLDYVKEGHRSRICALYGTYQCGDGDEVYLLALGAGVVRRLLGLLGLEQGGELFPDAMTYVPVDTPAAQVLEDAFAAYLATRSAEQVEDELADAGVPCSRLMDYAAAVEHPHYRARGVFTQWTASDGRTQVPGVKVVPEVAGHPGRIWRGAPTIGQDNDDILAELGYPDAARDALYAAGQLSRREYFETTGS
ncbi:MAG: CoA transferase [Actinobacteria bacterium]|nr:CoA transferase [Actinomycetota bacterium]